MSFIKEIIDFTIRPIFLLSIFVGFVAFTIIGTLTHEMGHIALAKFQGYETHLGYGYMYPISPNEKEITAIYLNNDEAIEEGRDFPDKPKWEALVETENKHGFWITLGGPLQTILTGTIAFVILYRRKNRIASGPLKFADWILIFLSLFWLREVANPLKRLLSSTMRGNPSLVGGGGDEAHLERYLDLWEGTITLPLAFIALVIATYVMFKIIPKPLRFTFILSGFLGGIIGFCFWFYWAGPILLP